MCQFLANNTHPKNQDANMAEKQVLKHVSPKILPILLQMVTSNSPTVLESSTMTVFTEPSNIRIFWGLCFFLYSNIS